MLFIVFENMYSDEIITPFLIFGNEREADQYCADLNAQNKIEGVDIRYYVESCKFTWGFKV